MHRTKPSSCWGPSRLVMLSASCLCTTDCSQLFLLGVEHVLIRPDMVEIAVSNKHAGKHHIHYGPDSILKKGQISQHIPRDIKVNLLYHALLAQGEDALANLGLQGSYAYLLRWSKGNRQKTDWAGTSDFALCHWKCVLVLAGLLLFLNFQHWGLLCVPWSETPSATKTWLRWSLLGVYLHKTSWSHAYKFGP